MNQEQPWKKQAEEKRKIADFLHNEVVLADRPRRGYVAIPVKTYVDILDLIEGKTRKGVSRAESRSDGMTTTKAPVRKPTAETKKEAGGRKT